MLFPKFLSDKFANAFISAEKLQNEVMAAEKSSEQLCKGDFVVISFKDSDIVGYITEITQKEGNSIAKVATQSNEAFINLKDVDSIYVISIAKKIDHTNYERDLKKPKENDLSKFIEPENVNPIHTKSSKLNLTGQIQSKAYTFKAGDYVWSTEGSPAQLIEILGGTEDQAAMGILRTLDGKSMGAEFLIDLTLMSQSELDKI